MSVLENSGKSQTSARSNRKLSASRDRPQTPSVVMRRCSCAGWFSTVGVYSVSIIKKIITEKSCITIYTNIYIGIDIHVFALIMGGDYLQRAMLQALKTK